MSVPATFSRIFIVQISQEPKKRYILLMMLLLCSSTTTTHYTNTHTDFSRRQNDVRRALTECFLPRQVVDMQIFFLHNNSINNTLSLLVFFFKLLQKDQRTMVLVEKPVAVD